MKAQLQTAGVVVIALLCGVSQALPQQTGQDSPEACVQTCIDSIIQSGACDDNSSNQASCVCGVCKPDPKSGSCIPTLQSCVQSSCPPSFADPTAQYCGTGPFSSSSTSENLYTIQTDTTAWMTKQSTASSATPTRSTSTTGIFNPSSVASPRITPSATASGTGTVVSPGATTAAPVSSPASSGNAAASKADLGSPWKGLLVAGLGMMMAIVIA